MPTRSPAQRETEGTRAGAVSRGDRGTRGRGRPKGSRNRPKGLIPLPLAEDIIKSLQPVLPPEQLRYLRSVVKDGASIDTRKELDTLILLLNRSIWPALVSEAVPYDTTDIGTVAADGEDEDDEGQPVDEKRPPTTILRKDVTDRLKVLNSLLNLRAQLDKRETTDDEDREQPVLKLFAQRGLETRIAVLVNNDGGPLHPAPRQLDAGVDDVPSLPAPRADEALRRPLDVPQVQRLEEPAEAVREAS